MTFFVTVFASISASTAVVGLDPLEVATTPEPMPATQTETTSAPPTTIAAFASTEPTPVASTSAAAVDPCREFLLDTCVETSQPAPEATEDVRSCSTGVDHSPQNTFAIVPRSQGDPASSGAVRIRVEVENGLEISGECFAGEALGILTDERGWSSVDDVTFTRVDDDSYDLRLLLASPGTTDSLCYPARTAGKFSCRKGDLVIINLMRWEFGTDEYQGDLSTYRTYLINHEVGHYLGKGHVNCPAAGEPAPVMMQQTKGLGTCLPNGWPTKDEN